MAKNKAITIGGVEVKPGTRASINVPIADLYTGTSLSMPVKVFCGKSAGPVLFVSAAVHGDELNGVEVIRRLQIQKALRSVRGTLITVPVVNVHGFLNQSRYLPDRRDLNRSFPGSAKGSIASRTAHTFLNEIVKKAEYGIDLHTGAINRSNLPQIRANLDDAKTEELARVFGAPVILNASIRDGSLRSCAADRGFPMLVYEAGEALRFDSRRLAWCAESHAAPWHVAIIQVGKTVNCADDRGVDELGARARERHCQQEGQTGYTRREIRAACRCRRSTWRLPGKSRCPI